MPGSPVLVRSDINLPDHPILTDLEFQALILRYQNGDPEAKDVIVQHNLRLVMSIAQRFSARGEIDDLFQIGCMGLIKAIDKFNLSYKVKFSTYAVPMIIGEIKQYLRDEGPIKISRGLKEIASKVEQSRIGLGGVFGREPTVSELEEATGFSREEIAVALEATRPVNSIHEVIHEDDGEPLVREQLIGEDGDHSRWLEHYALREVIAKLPPRLKYLIELRFFQEKTQTEVAAIFGVSQVQICRLEKEAMHQLRSMYLNEEVEKVH